MVESRKPRAGRGPRADTRARASHSLSAVLDGAIAILDESGATGLTIRALAARLGGGPASIYWYVSGRDELLDLAADAVLQAPAEASVDAASDDPIANLRVIAHIMFDAIAKHPWVSMYAMRNTVRQANSLLLYERIGEEVMRLGLGPKDCFYAASAVVGFVIGTAADLGQEPPEEVVSGAMTREQYQSDTADEWRVLPQAQYPFVHHIMDEFATHDDTEQFRAGLDLLLDGLALRAQRG